MAIDWVKDGIRYGKSLRTKEWRDKRKQILARDNNRCQACGSIKNLQIHHKQIHYDASTRGQKTPARKLPWKYPDNLMITLCRDCHNKGHQRKTLPKYWVVTRKVSNVQSIK
jgi:5-methylcytosine-specific restriction endonuclease McrA